MVYILDEIVTKLILLPKYQQFSLKPEPQIGKKLPAAYDVHSWQKTARLANWQCTSGL
jgi:hypothetical protein